MSTVTKIDASPVAIAQFGLPAEFWRTLGGKSASRWGGVVNPRWGCWTFSIKLPQDVEAAFRVMLLAAHEAEHGKTNTVIRKSSLTVAKKIATVLGWPQPIPLAPDIFGPAYPEEPFVQALFHAPGDLAAWRCYADWLTEQGCERGETISRWLSDRRWTQKELREEFRKKRYETWKKERGR